MKQLLHVENPGKTARLKKYPDGTCELLVCNLPVFMAEGWEPEVKKDVSDKSDTLSAGDVDRAIRRAKAQVKDLALCTPFRYFVTLTLDAQKIDRYDIKVITRKLNQWLDNRVRRKGLCYVLVPELHKDGAVHFHGFFNDALEARDSGTIIPPGGGKPTRPTGPRQAAKWLAAGGRTVYNLPDWDYGFTTAVQLVGDYHKAVSYVCKYIGKDFDRLEGGKIGGRWYYSGGRLGRPEVELLDGMSLSDVRSWAGDSVQVYEFGVQGTTLHFVQASWKVDRDEI